MGSLTSRFFPNCKTDSRNILSAGEKLSTLFFAPACDVCIVRSPFPWYFHFFEHIFLLIN